MSAFASSNDPLAQFSDRLAMLLFRRGDVRPASEKIICDIPDTKNAVAKYSQSFRELGFIAQIGSRAGGANLAIATEAAWTDEMPLNSSTLEILRQKLNRTGIAESSTGELQLDSSKGILKICTPRTVSISLPSGSESTAQLTICNADAPQTISASSLDGECLSKSGRILLLHLTDTLNFQAKFSDSNRNTLYQWGSSQLLVRRGKANVAFLHDAAAEMDVFALNADGSVAQPIARRIEGRMLFFTIDTALTSKGVMAYLIARRK